jgi:S-adenosylmethionine:tRNA-ribosyltransferase-isomerase (queuine synthetase)
MDKRDFEHLISYFLTNYSVEDILDYDTFRRIYLHEIGSSPRQREYIELIWSKLVKIIAGIVERKPKVIEEEEIEIELPKPITKKEVKEKEIEIVKPIKEEKKIEIKEEKPIEVKEEIQHRMKERIEEIEIELKESRIERIKRALKTFVEIILAPFK